ncbi:MAG: DUF4097 family beta strand repeat-containing protein [Planctomycetota bacterium]|jgi:hypothetical protein
MRTGILTLMLAAVVAWLGGCGAGAVLRHPFDPEVWSYRSQEDEPITLDVAGPVAIDVDSFGGNVIVTADERLSQATVTITREARHGSGRKKEAKRSLAEIGYSAVVVPGASGPELEIRTWTGHAEPHFQRAHLQIGVPAVHGLTVRTRRGLVEAIDIEGAVHIECAEGDVRVMTNRPMRRAVTVLNHEGDIDYRVRGESTGAFDCETADGEVLYRARQGWFAVEEVTHATLRAVLNDGGNPVRLRTSGGNIRVAVVHDPTQVGKTIVDP